MQIWVMHNFCRACLVLPDGIGVDIAARNDLFVIWVLELVGDILWTREVIARRRPIPDWAAQGDYENDPEFRRRIQEWVSEIWAEKDALIESRL